MVLGRSRDEETAVVEDTKSCTCTKICRNINCSEHGG